jgi:hypothetical protein
MLSLIAQELMDKTPTDTRLTAIEAPNSSSGTNDSTVSGQGSNTTESGCENMDSKKDDPHTDSEEMSVSGQSNTDPTEIERKRIHDIIRLAPTSNGELASEWNLSSGKKAYYYISDNLSDYFRRDAQSRIVPTEKAIQSVEHT